MPGTDIARDASFGQQGKITAVDRAGVWLSGHQIRRTVGSLEGKSVGDFGCGYEASYMRSVLGRVKSATILNRMETDHGVDPDGGRLDRR